MVRLEERMVVHAPVETVFEYMSRFENDAQWRDEVLDSRRMTPTEHGVGERYEQLMTVDGHQIRVDFEVTQYEQNRRLGFRGTAGDVSARGTYDLTARQDGTTAVDVSAEINVSGALEATEPYIVEVVSLAGRRDLQHLAELLDTEPPG